VADLIGCVMDFVLSFVRPSVVCPVRASNSKTNNHSKPELVLTFIRAGVTVVPFSSRKG